MMAIVTVVLAGIYGFVIGVPMQLALVRSPMRMRLRGVRQHCTNCGTPTTGAQRLSIAAFLSRRNNCSLCAHSLWTRWPWVELLSAACSAFVAARLGWAPALPAYLVFFSALLAITIIDLRHYLIPNRIVYPALFACLLLLIPAAIDSGFDVYLGALAGMAAGWFFFFVVWFVNQRALGFGDVRLSALNGLMTGWLGLGNVVLAILLGLLSAAVIGLLLLITRARSRKDPIPFGPFLALGAALSILFAGVFTGQGA